MLKSIAVTAVSMLAGHLFVLLITRWLHWLFPFQPAPGQTRWSLKQLERLYTKVSTRLFYWWLFGGWIVPALAWYLILKALAVIVHSDPGPHGIIMAPSNYYWAGIAFVASSLTLLAAQPIILKRVLKHRYPEYRLYRKWKSGRAVPLLVNIGAAVTALILAVSVYLFAATYTAFTPTRIVVAQSFRPTQVYRYDDTAELRGMISQKSGTKKQKSWYEIEFYEGTVWHAGYALRFADPCDSYPFIAYAAAQSGKSISGPDLQAEAGCR